MVRHRRLCLQLVVRAPSQTAFEFLISWLFNRTGGSVLIPMLFHLTSNPVGGGIMIPLFSELDHDRYYILFVVFAWLPALWLNWPRNWSMGRQVPSA